MSAQRRAAECTLRASSQVGQADDGRLRRVARIASRWSSSVEAREQCCASIAHGPASRPRTLQIWVWGTGAVCVQMKRRDQRGEADAL
ncbi:hypothetical protein FA09DRAFT_270619 [Tilletiopsis washingtonensis]|uniref:Uncharacterized protein n=1 Tax=Tilletiopsis washingtonensis TaxID=58919 RepID=A0A316ZED0_9BASI|nr:hypothetical protein FA09DRAFT_270619 [Tilletiopsis washingtonensis]PWN98603.1 hypothetical protein FA09DRAFT_270619 [Tilletiopsis washingtonensis]